ncbi:hypothetical protein AVEN_140127-1 [Araneus ventricosus]|uniref:Uncharacterized protein n=1 Tax=Araneus ventricosus TaxID=182803 RepID=A0A4Y2S5C6_ARAVE|nr:hypothetical protein AVEN_140127-1 [Araneus ventricosus]
MLKDGVTRSTCNTYGVGKDSRRAALHSLNSVDARLLTLMKAAHYFLLASEKDFTKHSRLRKIKNSRIEMQPACITSHGKREVSRNAGIHEHEDFAYI